MTTSLWAATAVPPLDQPRLSGDHQADVAIIGAGYTGLSAAHHLAGRGAQAVVVEADAVGNGGSGRNGGVVSAKFRVSFPAIAKAHGLAVARRMHDLADEAVDAVETLVAHYGLGAAAFSRAGNLRCAHNRRSLDQIVSEAEWLRRDLGVASVSQVSREEVAAETGSASFVGGVLTSGAGSLHPLNYARGLAAGLTATGTPVFENSPVLRIEQDGAGVRLLTQGGSIRARQVLVATNAYSGRTPATSDFQRTLIPFRSAIIATEVLPADLDRRLLREGRSYGETRRMMRWFRKVQGRILFGGRGAFGAVDDPAAFEALRRAMVVLFPDLTDVGIAHRWSGFVGLTLDALPHVGRRDERTCFALGYNGAGVAMSTLLGRYAADILLGGSPDLALLRGGPRPIPFYGLREPVVRLTAGWYQALDAVGL